MTIFRSATNPDSTSDNEAGVVPPEPIGPMELAEGGGIRMFGDRFSSSTSCSRWLHETEPGRLDQAFSGRFLKV